MKHLRKVLCLAYDSQSRREGIIRFATRHNWFLEFKRTTNLPADWRGDGVLITQDLYESVDGQRLIKSAQRKGIPVVLLEADHPDATVPHVSGDDRAIGRLAAGCFNERHFQHAAFFSAYDRSQSVCQTARLAGFREAWTGLSLDVWLWANQVPEKDLENFDRLESWLKTKLRRTPKPLAVFAWNDVDASRILSVCLQAGLNVPGDVSILGVDNYTDICEHAPVKLSSIKHDLIRVGHVGAAMLERLMAGGKLLHRAVRVKPQGIITRESTTPLVVYPQEIRPVIAYIDGNLSHTFGAGEISRALNIPRGRLDYIFKIKVGHSVGTEIATRRINLAKSLLRLSELSVDAIAQRCGYCNRSFFSKRFRQATGFAPLAWRRATLPSSH